MNEKEQKKLASSIVLKARAECRKRKIDPYIAIGAFIDETIRELTMVVATASCNVFDLWLGALEEESR